MRHHDRNDVFKTHSFATGRAQPDLRALAGFMTAHAADLRREREWRLVSDLARAVDSAPELMEKVTSPDRWNIPALLQKTEDWRGDERTTLRKPKVVVNMDVTLKGNLSVTWRPIDGSDDFTFREYEFQRVAPYRPMNEFFFARGFGEIWEDMEAGVDSAEDKWRHALRLKIAQVTLAAVGDLIEDMGRHCDVTIDRRIVAETDVETGMIIALRHDSLGEIQQRQEEERAIAAEEALQRREAHESARIRGLQDVVESAQSRYGLSAARLMGLMDAIREHRVPFPETLLILERHFGMKHAQDGDNHVGVTRSIRRAMRELGQDPEALTVTAEEIAGYRQTSQSPARAVPASLSDRLESRIRRHVEGKPAAVPAPSRPGPRDEGYYVRLRPYAASDEELRDAGLASVDELVREVNEALQPSGNFVTQGDYPTTRTRFEKLVRHRDGLRNQAAPAPAQ